jgi:deazaflavin-dependent oxidoreductase (nitroreductase family)
MPTDPFWARNLRRNPDATVHVRRAARRVHARLARGEERAGLWESITAQAPIYLDYERRAARHREIPVFILEDAS